MFPQLFPTVTSDQHFYLKLIFPSRWVAISSEEKLKYLLFKLKSGNKSVTLWRTWDIFFFFSRTVLIKLRRRALKHKLPKSGLWQNRCNLLRISFELLWDGPASVLQIIFLLCLSFRSGTDVHTLSLKIFQQTAESFRSFASKAGAGKNPYNTVSDCCCSTRNVKLF